MLQRANITGRLALGTVQFGMDYGITDAPSRLALAEVGAILAGARAGGLDTIDTAIAYGESEKVLGTVGIEGWQVYTKLPEVPEEVMNHRAGIGHWVAAQMDQSLARLRLPNVAGLMLHRPSQLRHRNGSALYDALCTEKVKGRAERIGVSVYGPEDLDALPVGMTYDIVQAPLNLLDMRMVTSGWLDRLAAADCAFHARSVFLQGLLLLPAVQRSARFAPWEALWNDFDRFLVDAGITAVAACLRHVLALSEVERVLVGVTSVAQLSEILKACSGEMPPVPESLANQDVRLLNPSKWPTQ